MKTLMPAATLLLGAALLALPGLGCNQPKSGGGTAAAPTQKPKSEGELAYLLLAQDEVKNLVETQKIKPRLVQAHADLTGWVTPKQGHEVTLTAPVPGYVLDPARDRLLPIVGQMVQADDVLLRIRPQLSPVEIVQVDLLKNGVELEVTKAKETLKLAGMEYERTYDLSKSGLAQQQDLDQKAMRLKHAQKDFEAAESKMKLFLYNTLAVVAPRAGKVAIVHVSPGQYVPAAAPLLTILDFNPVWVRVPLPEEDLPRLDRQQDATVALRTALAERGKADNGKVGWAELPSFTAALVAVVPLVDPGRHTVDVIYELKQAQDRPVPAELFAKDLMVTAHLPLGEKRDESLVPYSAVVFDAHGGAWIYLDRGKAKSGKQQYQRQRIEVGARVGNAVIVRPTLAADTSVVTRGAAELFSIEFYKARVNP